MSINNNILEKEKLSKNDNLKNDDVKNVTNSKKTNNAENSEKINVAEKENKISDNNINVSNSVETNNTSQNVDGNSKINTNSKVPANPDTNNYEFKPLSNSKPKSIMTIFTVLVMIVFSIILILIIGFTTYNFLNTKIISGVYIKGIDVSNLSKSDAKYQIDNLISQNLPDEIQLKHNDFIATVSLSQMETQFDTKNATEAAYKVGRQGNLFENNLHVLNTMFSHVDIEPTVKINEDLLSTYLDSLSSQLPDTVIQSSYYVEGNNLIVTSGTEGNVVDIPQTIQNIKSAVSDFSCKDNPVEIAVKTEQPQAIDIEKIHNEIYKEPVDAYYTQNPFMVYPSENGVDFNISIDEAKALLAEPKSEYTIPLKYITPNVTTNMIGTEAFPDLLSTFSTNYSTRDADRTTNLRLAANKINGTVLMPGETFSYNQVVGARTIAAGYKEAPIYVSGEVVDGLGGGICQITSTLYNAVLYANLEIVERSNHQFVPSYVTASRDATVVYGSIDFKFKNNRDYPIKLVCSVSGGIANFQIFGMKTENDYEVEISSYQTGKTATAIYSEAYKILKKNGQVVSKELLSKDTYKRH